MRKLSSLLVWLVLTMLTNSAHAGFHKCVSADGSISYQQIACPQDTQSQTSSVSILGAGKVSLETQVEQSCGEWGGLTHTTGRALELEVLTCKQNFYPLCDETAMGNHCRKQLAELNQKISLAKASALARQKAAGVSAPAMKVTASDLIPVSCREAAQVMANDKYGPNEVRIRCQQEMDQACAAGRDADSCRLFHNKLSMTVSGLRTEKALTASGDWDNAKNDWAGNLNELWTACMGRAAFATDNATFLRRKAECDGLAP